jgi:ATP-dependent Lhr-like helicase
MLHVDLDRVSPMAVPVLVIVGREATATGTTEDSLLIEAESLAEQAMRLD